MDRDCLSARWILAKTYIVDIQTGYVYAEIY